uniref:Uncharacterized protein n=1 Tax=Panagrolaimus davidi TaxID=227884 RepID=A0A914PXU5_9BILA
MVASSKLIPTPVFYGKRAWPGGPSFQQNWSLPNSMIYYIAKNPSSSKIYQKLVHTCKFFFEKNPVIIIKNLDAFQDGTKYHISQNRQHECKKNNYECCIKIDLNNFSSKLWITRGLNIHKHIKNCIATIVQKNFRYEILRLGVADNDIIFNDLKVLVSFAKRVFLWRNSIKYKNGTVVMFDKILELFPTNIVSFWFDFEKDVSMVNDSTMENILKLQNLENLECFYLHECPGTLSVEDLSAFIKIIGEIIKSGVPNRVIKYDGQDEEKLEIMISRWAFNGITPFEIIEEDVEEEVEDLENNDGFDVENEPGVDDELESHEIESDAGITFYIALLFNKIKNLL